MFVTSLALRRSSMMVGLLIASTIDKSFESFLQLIRHRTRSSPFARNTGVSSARPNSPSGSFKSRKVWYALKATFDLEQAAISDPSLPTTSILRSVNSSWLSEILLSQIWFTGFLLKYPQSANFTFLIVNSGEYNQFVESIDLKSGMIHS